MRLLLDTMAFLWANAEPGRLGDQRAVVEDERNELLVSAATSWELAIKVALGRIELPAPVGRYVPERIRLLGATPVAVEHGHALAVATLPPVHRDPFDRLLVAQANVLSASLISADPVFESYDVSLLPIRRSR